MKNAFLILAFFMSINLAYADMVDPPQRNASTETITGAEATKLAQLLGTQGNQNATYAQGSAQISCVKKSREADYTCVVKVFH